MGRTTAPAIRRGDHACCVFGSDADQTELVAHFARDALARGDRLLYFADQSDEQRVLDMLAAGGIRGRAQLESGRVQVVDSAELALENGFDRNRQYVALRALAEDARSAGYQGLAVLSEGTWAHTWKIDEDVLVDYERGAGHMFANGDLSALCQYDARHFDAAVISRVMHAHPYAVDVRHGWTAEWSRLHVEQEADGRLLTLGGDIDVANTHFLERQLTELLSDGDAAVDLANVEFIDVAGCRLLRKAERGELARGRLVLHNPPAVFSRVLRVCDLGDHRS